MHLERSLAALGIAMLGAGCAHGLPPTPHTTKLIVERQDGAVRPSIRATVAGHPITLVIDTGAEGSVLPIGFIEKYHVPIKSTTANQLAFDIHGTLMSLARAPGTAVQFEGEASAVKIDFFVNPSDSSESVGYLAPSDVVRSGWAMVLDFERSEFRYEPEETALKRGSMGKAPLKEIEYKSCRLDEHRIVPVTINGISTSLIVDTGAARTTMTRNNEAIPSMASMKGKRSVVSGFASLGRQLVVSRVPLEFADASFEVMASVLPTTEACGRGLLGADVLSQCIVVWGSSSLWASCRPQSTPE